MTRLVLDHQALTRTLDLLKMGGAHGQERMAVWLGKDAGLAKGRVQEVYEPQQICERDRFYLPPASMTALMERLGRSRLKILAQIHTHPGAAFHSEADDAWAIIRHQGALSLVLPTFARTTTVDTFLNEVMVYRYSASGAWVLTPSRGPAAYIEIVP